MILFLIYLAFGIPMGIWLVKSLTPDYEITVATLVVGGSLLVWTAFIFYLMGRASIMTYFYY